MRQKAISLFESIRDRIAYIFLILVGTFIGLAFLFQVFFMYLEFSGNGERAAQIAREIQWRIDGTWKNSPGNIWYNAEEHIYVQNVTNLVKVGKLSGNRNLEFGVKNVLEEYLQDKGYNITPDAQFYLDVDILYLDQVTTKKGVSVLGKTDNAVVIKLRGTLFKEGLKTKEVEIEESSSEIAMTTLIVDTGGKFNQTSLSNALKKGCDKLVTKLFEK